MLKPKRKITKKDLKQDEFLEFVVRAERFLRHNVKLLAYIGVGVVVVVAVALLMVSSRKHAEIQAAAALGAVQSIYDQGQYQQVIDQLKPVVQQFAGTKSAGIGVFYIASAYDRLGDDSSAAQYYQQYLDKYDNDPLLGAAALASLGGIEAGNGQYDEALTHYQQAIRRAPHRFMAQQYSLEAAQIAFDAGQTEKARTMLSALLGNETLQANVKSDAQELLSMIDVQTAD